MAITYELLDQIQDAIRCYERAEYNKDREGIALNKLGKLYSTLNENDKAAYYYKKNLERRDEEQLEGQETIDALLFLAQHCTITHNFDDAEKYCSRLLDYAGKEKE